jgi:hypothetical protein
MTINHTRKPITRRASAILATAGLLLAVVIAGCGGAGTSSQPARGASSAAHGHGAPAKAPVNGSNPAAATTAAAAASGSQQKPPTPTTESGTPAASSENGGIPQNNGGDQDADNNGGPSDGDGNV